MYNLSRTLQKVNDTSYLRKSYTLENLINDNKLKLIVILGEPASGKSWILKKYNEKNQKTSKLYELVSLEAGFDVDENIEVLLLDSIDEGMLEEKTSTKFINALINELKKHTEKTFVITCRSLEWEKFFENKFQEIIKAEQIQIFNFSPMQPSDKKELCSSYDVDYDKFYNVIQKSFLEGFSQNIFMLIGMVQLYKNNELTNKLVDIYQKLIDMNLVNENDDKLAYRNEANENALPIEVVRDSIEKIAIFMMFQNKVYVNIRDVAQILPQLPRDDLNRILNTKLFIKEQDSIKFFHKSFQEFLAAKYLHVNKIPFRKIKQLVLKENVFFEKYEELIAYYINFNEQYFEEVLSIDPFILRRHPFLSEEQERQLAFEILSLLQKDKSVLWGNWSNLYNTTLVKFKYIESIVQELEKRYPPEKLNYSQLEYISYIVMHNKSSKLEDYVIKVLHYLDKKEIPDELLTMSSSNRLILKIFEIFEDKKGFDNVNEVTLDTFICRLYGIISFDRLLPLFFKVHYEDNLASDIKMLKLEDVLTLYNACNEDENDNHIACLLGCLTWFIGNYQKCKEYREDFISWLFVEQLSKDDRAFYFHQPERVFSQIKDIFYNDIFDLFFKNDFEDRSVILEVLTQFFTYEALLLIDIKSLIKKHSLHDNLEAYRQLTNRIAVTNESIVNEHPEIKKWKENVIQNSKEINKKYKKILQEKENKENKRKENYQIFLNDIDRYWFKIFEFNHHREKFSDLKQILRNDLKDKYPKYIEILKQQFKTNELFKKIRKKEARHSHFSSLMVFLFKELEEKKELKAFIQTRDDYEKFFDYVYYGLNEESIPYMIEQSLRFPKVYMRKILVLIREKRKSHNFHESWSVKQVLKEIYQQFPNEVSHFCQIVFKILFDEKELSKEVRKALISLVTVDFNSFDLLKKYSREKGADEYTIQTSMIKIDLNKGLDAFFKDFEVKKIEKAKMILSIIYEYTGRHKKKNFELISSKHLYLLILAYYENLLDTKPNRPSGIGYTHEAADNWNDLKGTLLEELSRRGDEESFNKLTKSGIEELVDISRYYLKKIKKSSDKSNLSISQIRDFLVTSGEAIFSDDDLVELLLEVLEEIQSDFNGQYGIVNLLYKDAIHQKEKLRKELKKNYDKNFVDNYQSNRRTENHFQRLVAYMLNEKLKQKSFVLNREVEVARKDEANKLDILVKNGDISVIIECKRDNNKPHTYVKEQLIDKYLSRSEFNRLIYLIASYDEKILNSLEDKIQEEICKYQKEKEIFPVFIELFH